MKNIKLLLAGLLLTSFFFASAHSSPAYAALTSDQKKSCRNDWDGKTLSTGAKRQKFKDTPCAKEGYCNLGSGNKVTCGGGGGGGSTPSTTIKSCDDIHTSLIDCDTSTRNPVQSLLLQVINFLAVGVGIAVVGGIIWGGMIYASSNGDASKVQQAKTIIVNAVIGLLLFFFMYGIINYLVPGGLFT